MVPALLACFAVIGAAQVLRRRAPVPAVVAAIAVMALVVLPLVPATPAGQDGLTGALVAIPLALVPVAWARTVRRHRELTAAERRAAVQAARIAELDRDAARHDERNRIARDLHDVVAGHVSSIALQATAATAVAAAADPALMTAALGRVRVSSVQALDEMRAMIDVLSASELGPAPADDTPGRLSDLPLLVEAARAGGLAVALHAGPPPAELSGAVELSAYRIAQEALTNAAAHAPTGRATLTVGTRGPRLVIEMCNERSPGPAADVAGGDGGDGGRGLLTMREWAGAVGGSCVAGPEGDLWRVRAELPRHPG